MLADMEKKKRALQRQDTIVQRKIVGINGDFTEREAMSQAEKYAWINVAKEGSTEDKIAFENAIFDKSFLKNDD